MRPTRESKPPNLRFEILNALIDLSMSGLTRAELATWLVLYRDAKRPDWTARTSVSDIARRAGASRQAVSAAIASLQARKLLRVVRRGGLNRGTSSYVVWPVPSE